MFFGFLDRRTSAFNECLRTLEQFTVGDQPLDNDKFASRLLIVTGGLNRSLAKRRCAHIIAQLRCAVAERSGDLGGFYASAVLDSQWEL